MEELEFDHQPCHDKLKALKAKFRQRQLDSSAKLVAQIEGLTKDIAILYQLAYLRGLEEGRRGPLE